MRYTHAVTHTPSAHVIIRRFALGVLAIITLTVAAPLAAAQTGTATEFYMQYRAAFDKAQKIDELLPFLAAKNRQKVEETPAGERVKFFELMKMFGTMSNVKVLKAAKNSGGELLSVEGTTEGKKQTCAVQIVNEKGAWKLGEEKCEGAF